MIQRVFRDNPELKRCAALLLFLGAIFATPPARASDGQYSSLEEAFKNPLAVTTLILNHTPLSNLPSQIAQLQNLQVLILNRNGLQAIPPEITALKHLRAIYLGGSPRLDFHDVIEKLARLPQLEGIGLDDNAMGTVPGNIGKLKSCHRLGLSSNDLKSLPGQIGQLSSLESLDLYNNQLVTVPAQLAVLTGLRKVFIKNSGLSTAEKTRLAAMIRGVQLVEDTPPELYMSLP